MSPKFQLCAAAAAVAAAFALPAQAQTIVGAGASGSKNALFAALLSEDCDQTQPMTVYDNTTAGTTPSKLAAGGVYLVQCTPLSGGRFTNNPLQVSYDTTGGSWKAFTATTQALLTAAQNNAGTLNLNPVKTIDQTFATCGTGTNISVGYTAKLSNSSIVTVTYSWGCSATALATTDTVTFGLTDTETKMFTSSTANLPMQDLSWNSTPAYLVNPLVPGPEPTGFPKAVFGAVFGVAASGPLWLALQQDQLNNGVLDTTLCGTTAAATTVELCMPVIGKGQYASIITNTGGALNNSAAGLFVTTTTGADYSLELARRDQGSGSQATSNAFFVEQGCANSATELPDSVLLPSATVQHGGTKTNTLTYNPSTSDVIQRLQLYTTNTSGFVNQAPPTSGFVIGMVSAENYSTSTISGTGAAGTSTAPWGFLRLDGFAPTVTNFKRGFYNYVTEDNLHCNSLASGDGLQLCNDLAGNTPGALNTLLTYNGTGDFVITPASATVYTNKGKMCFGPRHS